MKDGTRVKGKNGWVHFRDGQLPEYEYKKFLTEEKAKEKEAKAKEREEKQLEKDHRAFIDKIQRKIKEHDIFIAELQNTDKLTEDEVLEVVERTERINTRILKGDGLMDVALSENISRPTLSAFLAKYYGAFSFSAYKKTLKSRHQAIKTPWGTKEKRNVRFFMRVPFRDFKDRLEAHADPIVSTEDKSYMGRWYAKAEPGQLFSKEIQIVSERTQQPIKRTRIAAHSFLSAGDWRNGTKLLTVKCKLAEKEEDKYLTSEGGVIISQKFALKQNMDLGDKISGVNGLKGIVSEIRKQTFDLIINKNQIWGAKMSRLCGGAVFEIAKGELSVFYQPDHKIQRKIPESEAPKVGFSPDLVPFLAYYLTAKELGVLQGDNRKRFQDILYMLNLEIVNKEDQLTLLTKATQPTSREGGELYPFEQVYWGRKEWVKGLEKEKVVMGKAGMKYPFVLHNIWVPDWFIEQTKKPVDIKLNGKVIGTERKDSRFVENIKKFPENAHLASKVGNLLHTFIFADVEESLSYLVAIAKDGEPDTILLNKVDCKKTGISEGDWVLIYRNPVVDRLNIQKMKVKFGDIPQTTIGINVESIRLMHGDFDGDALYLIKIPQTKDFAKKFAVNFATYNKERKDVFEEIKESDEVKLPKDERHVKIAQRIAYYQSKIDAGIWQPRRLEIFEKKLASKHTGHIRTDTELKEEAKDIHENLNTSGTKAEKIGIATKWMWLAPRISEKDIDCVASLEVIKDRADKDSELKYENSLDILNECKNQLRTISKKSGSSVISWQARAFLKVVTKGTFKKKSGKGKDFPNLSNLKDRPIVEAGTPFAKFILALVRRVAP